MQPPDQSSLGRELVSADPGSAEGATASTTPTHYVTYFDRHYLSRGVALLRSLRRYCPSAIVWVICLDEQTRRALGALEPGETRLIPLVDLERADPELAATRSTRSLLEYYYTLTAPSILHVLRSEPSIDRLVYLDADTFFFGNPEPIIHRYRDASILLLDHYYPPEMVSQYEYGRFNVGLIVFYRTPDREPCLRRWREQCIEWCYDRVEGDRYGDQRYLDAWPTLYPDLVVPQERVIGLAPWNLATHAFSVANGRLHVNGEPVVNFHFSSVRRLTTRLYDSGLHRYGCALDAVTRGHLYLPYVRALIDAEQAVKEASGFSVSQDSVRRKRYEIFGRLGGLSKLLAIAATIRRRNLLVVGPGSAPTPPSSIHALPSSTIVPASDVERHAVDTSDHHLRYREPERHRRAV